MQKEQNTKHISQESKYWYEMNCPSLYIRQTICRASITIKKNVKRTTTTSMKAPSST